ncbi:MAG: M20 family metallopeptidase [Betaproteobacteria bacterium]
MSTATLDNPSTIALAQTLAQELRTWIECESPSNDPAAVHRMAQIVVAKARAAGLQVTLSEIGETKLPMIVATNRAPGDTRQGLLLLAHIDSVHPIGTLKTNPCRIEDDKLYGPGAFDMKGGAFLALTALGEFSKPNSTKLPVDFLLVPDEEVGSHASRTYIEDFAKKARYALVPEPARPNGGRCVTGRKGTGMLKLICTGRPSHAGMAHEKGRSAIREMAHQILALEAMTDYARGITVSVGTISGGTVTNTVPSHCEVMVDFRIPDEAAGEEIVARIQALKPHDPDVTLTIDVELNRPPMVKSPAADKLLQQLKQYATPCGFELDEAPVSGGGSDANFTSAVGCPSIDGLGAEGDGAHTLREHVFVSVLPRRLEFWRNTLANIE